jgi:hypothetical protein
MQQNQQPPNNWLADTKQSYDVLLALLRVMAFPEQVFTTKLGTWGNRYLGPRALLGILWPLMFGGFYGPARGYGWLFLFWLGMLVTLVLHRIKGWQLQNAGYRCHSQYWGTSRFEGSGVDLSGQESARAKVFFLTLLVGFFCFGALCKPLGAMLMLGAIAKLITEVAMFQSTRARLRQMEDARHDTEYYAELYRQKNRMN